MVVAADLRRPAETPLLERGKLMSRRRPRPARGQLRCLRWVPGGYWGAQQVGKETYEQDRPFSAAVVGGARAGISRRRNLGVPSGSRRES
jgi:hypothetical protein